jgi:hypothetical protein
MLIYMILNQACILCIGTGDYGCLHDILEVPTLYVNLISISKLCNYYDFLTLTLILDRTLLHITTLEHATVEAANLHCDNLYHVSDLSSLLHEKYRSRANALKSTNGSSFVNSLLSAIASLRRLHERSHEGFSNITVYDH